MVVSIQKGYKKRNILSRLIAKLKAPIFGKTISDKLKLVVLVSLALFYSVVLHSPMKNIAPMISSIKIRCHMNRSGYSFVVDNINHLYFVVNVFEDDEIEIIKKLDIDGVVIDVGAYIGTHSIPLASIPGVEKVVAIEPEAQNFSALQTNIKTNDLSNKIIAVRMGAFSKNGKMTLFKSEGGSSGNSLVVKPMIILEKQEVEVKRLDDILAELGLNVEKVSFVKVDTEGAEMHVFRGAKKIMKSHPKIVFEALEERKFLEIRKYLGTLGYKKIKEINDRTYLAE